MKRNRCQSDRGHKALLAALLAPPYAFSPSPNAARAFGWPENPCPLPNGEALKGRNIIAQGDQPWVAGPNANPQPCKGAMRHEDLPVTRVPQATVTQTLWCPPTDITRAARTEVFYYMTCETCRSGDPSHGAHIWYRP